MFIWVIERERERERERVCMFVRKYILVRMSLCTCVFVCLSESLEVFVCAQVSVCMFVCVCSHMFIMHCFTRNIDSSQIYSSRINLHFHS